MLPQFLLPETTIREAGAGSELALGELWGAIVDLMPFPCEPEWNDESAINVRPSMSNRHCNGEFERQAILIHFGHRGLGMYQYSSDVTRQRTREDVVYVVTMILPWRRGFIWRTAALIVVNTDVRSPLMTLSH